MSGEYFDETYGKTILFLVLLTMSLSIKCFVFKYLNEEVQAPRNANRYLRRSEMI